MALGFVALYACKTDEFKFGELTVKDQWYVRVISPLVSGEIEFKDLIDGWQDSIEVMAGEQITVLQYPSGEWKTIPTRSIFDPTVVIDSFSFLIQGKYDLDSVKLKFEVANATPFPINLELHFFQEDRPLDLGLPVSPGPFPANFPDVATQSHTVLLDENQRIRFVKSDRIKLTGWYSPAPFIDAHDTLKSNYPIEISIVLIGDVSAKNEE